MIVTCASCLTKYHLDDSRVSEKGAKVRCSRCKHVFYVVRPPETQEQVEESFESFAKFHQELMEPDQQAVQPPGEEMGEAPAGMEGMGEDRETVEDLFSEQRPSGKAESVEPSPPEGSKGQVQEAPPKPGADLWKVRRSRPRSTRFLALLAIVTLLLFGFLYVWSEIKSGGTLATFLGDPVGKITRWWEKLWGAETEGLILKDLTAYEERVGELPLYIIEGKVTNQSTKLKKAVKVKVTIFDQNKIKVVEKEALCGPVLTRGELKNLPASFFAGDLSLQPKTEKETMVSPGSSLPFMVIFKELPPQAKEFKVEIVEAPSL